MKSLFDMWCVVTNDVGEFCDASTKRDIKTAASRFEDEGLSFLTITLPSFCSGFERALELEAASPDLWPFFKGRGSTPLFLGDLLDKVFDRKSGAILDDPSVDSIWGIRQICLLMSKIELPCSDARVARAMKGFIECESEVRVADQIRDPHAVADLKKVFNFLYSDVLTSLERKVHELDLHPRHGPGSTADDLFANAKWDQRTWTDRLEVYFPYGEYVLPNWRYYYLLDQVDFREPGSELPVEVICVPKTMKTPRIIAVEPTCMQYTQQALLQTLVPLLLSSRGEFIGFDDQVPNRNMAREGSNSGALATLDLSEASDRVSNQLVCDLMQDHRYLLGAVQSCRSQRADVPGHGIVPLAKFASMGSALTFPVESMVFLAIVFWSISRNRDCQSDHSLHELIHELKGKVRVYGDDIIVPADFASTVSDDLQAMGLKVNVRKSFWNGKFRESCGGDFYAGIDVSIVKVRRPLPTKSFSKTADGVSEMESAVSLRNLLYEGGLWRSASWLDSWISPLLRGRFPRVLPTSVGLGRVSYLGYDSDRMCDSHHAPRVRAYVPHRPSPPSGVSGEGALTKCLLNRGDPLSVDHLRRSGRPKSAAVRLRWVQPF